MSKPNLLKSLFLCVAPVLGVAAACSVSEPADELPVTLIYRSQYEDSGDELHDFDHPNERGGVTYVIAESDGPDYFQIDSSTGVLTIDQPIVDDAVANDEMGTVTEHALTIAVMDGSTVIDTIAAKVVDGFDYTLNLVGYTNILTGPTEMACSGEWAAFHNLRGMGKARPEQFRSAILTTDEMPNETIFVWDVPSKASAPEFGGKSTWGYVNLLVGNRTGRRDNVPNFPFALNDLDSIPVQFDYEHLFGDRDYKVAFNMFFTKENTLVPFKNNVGDFFLVVGQTSDWLPSYPVNLGDMTIGGRPFTRLYDNKGGYERRRVIIKGGNTLSQASFNLLDYFDMFAAPGEYTDSKGTRSSASLLDRQQSVSHMMFGLEIADSFGAVKVNQLSIDVIPKSEAASGWQSTEDSELDSCLAE